MKFRVCGFYIVVRDNITAEVIETKVFDDAEKANEYADEMFLRQLRIVETCPIILV